MTDIIIGIVVYDDDDDDEEQQQQGGDGVAVQGTVSIHISRCYVRIHSVVYPPEIPKF
jgi:hypothetical protein